MVYTYAPGRGADHAISLLRDFKGMLTTDSYQAYQTLAKARNDVVRANCWAHVRPRFFDLARGGSAPIAAEALVRIGQLYAIEADIRGQNPQARLAARTEKSAPLIANLKTWFQGRLAEIRSSSTTAELSATPSPGGPASPASSTMAASNWTPTPSIAPCGPSPSTERTACSPAQTKAPITWPSSPR